MIDHAISYIGGMNIGKKYANLDKVKTPWRDTQVRMVGPCAQVLDEYFLTDWLCAVRRRDWDGAVAYVDSIHPRTDGQNANLCQFIVGGVDTDKESVKMCYLSMIRSAKKRIRIQTPYFIPDASILDALKTAAAAGVEIELMIPGIKASFFLDPVTTYYCGQLLGYGAKIYKYSGYIHAKTLVVDEELCCIGSVNMDVRSLKVDDEICGVFYANSKIYKYSGYIHAKTLVVDEELCCIGSVNMDVRSLKVDDEICGVFYANSIVNRYSQQYDTDIGRCRVYPLEEFVSRSTWERFIESFFLMFAPLM